jgi:hypothetical protein
MTCQWCSKTYLFHLSEFNLTHAASHGSTSARAFLHPSVISSNGNDAQAFGFMLEEFVDGFFLRTMAFESQAIWPHGFHVSLRRLYVRGGWMNVSSL